jgi:beta-N-acetylhexosaminidase
VLFEKDLEPKETSKALTEMVLELQQNAPIPLFLAIDEEGGKVNRLKPKYGFPATVSAAYLGRLNVLDSTTYYAERTAHTLYKHGLNINFAPVVDLNTNPENPVIGKVERSFGSEATQVTRHATAWVDVHRKYKVGTVLKHFPGHGSSDKDTHLGMADVSDTWTMSELWPYQRLIDSGKVDAIMTAHIVNRALDPEMLPSTLSSEVIGSLLRGLMDYQGVVFSDDMHMAAISKEYGLEEAIVKAINAGVDVLVFSNNIFDDEKTSGKELHRLIRDHVESGDIPYERIEQSYNRIIKLKQKLGLLEVTFQSDLEARFDSIR